MTKPTSATTSPPPSGAANPAAAPSRLDLTAEHLAPRSPDPDYGDVTVSGLVRRNDTGTVVTLFLVNGQQVSPGRRELAVPGRAVGGRHRRRLPSSFAPGPPPTKPAPLTTIPKPTPSTCCTATTSSSPPATAPRSTSPPTPTIPNGLGASPPSPSPTYEVPQTQAPTATDIPALADVTFDMAALADTDDLPAALTPLVTAYRAWIDERAAEAEAGADRLDQHTDAARRALDACRQAADRIETAIDLLATDTDAEAAFRFANRAMSLQRLHTIAAEIRRNQPDRKLTDVIAEIDQPRNRSWRPFQLAFVLLNLPGSLDPTHPERGDTGPGRPALLPHRRRQDRGLPRPVRLHPGHPPPPGRRRRPRRRRRGGRPHALHAAAAHRPAVPAGRRPDLRLRGHPPRSRRAADSGDNPWGPVPFRIGLWVGGNVTPNRAQRGRAGHRRSPGTGAAGRGAPARSSSPPARGAGTRSPPPATPSTTPAGVRTLVCCGDPYGRCPFGRKHCPDEGIPVVTVDEEIYRLLPGLVIATADKFAQLPWQGPLTALFGRVTRRCARHGFRSPDLDAQIDEADSHRARKPLPAARTVPTQPLRPPDLIIQDELHLIAGPLGTLVGLYETAVDELCSWTVDGKRVRPKVVASTATIRRAERPGPRPVPPRPRGVPAAGARRRRLVLRPPGPRLQRRPRPALPRHLRPRPPPQGGRDPRLRGAPGRGPVSLRALRHGRRPVDDPRRLLTRRCASSAACAGWSTTTSSRASAVPTSGGSVAARSDRCRLS